MKEERVSQTRCRFLRRFYTRIVPAIIVLLAYVLIDSGAPPFIVLVGALSVAATINLAFAVRLGSPESEETEAFTWRRYAFSFYRTAVFAAILMGFTVIFGEMPLTPVRVALCLAGGLAVFVVMDLLLARLFKQPFIAPWSREFDL